jgi:hypothetical protein
MENSLFHLQRGVGRHFLENAFQDSGRLLECSVWFFKDLEVQKTLYVEAIMTKLNAIYT